MKHPVVWFEVLGNDGPKLQRFYAELFGWQIKSDGASGYGMVETGAKTGVPGGVGDPSVGLNIASRYSRLRSAPSSLNQRRHQR